MGSHGHQNLTQLAMNSEHWWKGRARSLIPLRPSALSSQPLLSPQLSLSLSLACSLSFPEPTSPQEVLRMGSHARLGGAEKCERRCQGWDLSPHPWRCSDCRTRKPRLPSRVSIWTFAEPLEAHEWKGKGEGSGVLGEDAWWRQRPAGGFWNPQSVTSSSRGHFCSWGKCAKPSWPQLLPHILHEAGTH